MSEPAAPQPERRADALRTAIERTFELAGRPARTGRAAAGRERAAELLDEVVRRGRGARGEVARRSRPAREELARRLEVLERRLATLEDSLRQSRSEPED